MELHPDRNTATTATAEFQLLTVAYNVLSDSKQRAAYDMQAAVAEPARTGNTAGSTEKTPPDPITCSVCSRITAQPRYAVFWEIKSFVVVSHRAPIQGIFCPTCAEKKALRATGITWLLGWWGIPWGPIYSLHAILSNLVGGEQPSLINARILTHQAYAFDARGQRNLAVGIAKQALKFAEKIPVSDPWRDTLAKSLEVVCGAAPASIPVMVNSWRLFRRPFFVQVGLVSTAILGLVLAATHEESTHGNYVASGPVSNVIPPRHNPVRPKPAYVRPATAPNGSPWPTAAGYIRHFKVSNTKGMSSITVDNTQSDSDVFVKLVSLNGSAAKAARQFFIPAFSQFTAKNLTKGSYRIEYEDLSTGRKYRGDPFEAEEIPMPGGVRFSEDSLTLYKVRDGNTNLAEIDDATFDADTAEESDTSEQLVRQ
jgi:DnaJ domain